MRVISLLVGTSLLFSTTGCSQIIQLSTEDVVSQDEIKNITLRTRTGEVYYFEKATVRADSLIGQAQETRTVYLEGGETSEISINRNVVLALDHIEQMQTRKRNYGQTALIVLGALAIAAGIVLLASSSGQSDDGEGGGSGGGKPPPLAPTDLEP